ITSTFGKSGTFTGLSGFVTNGLVRMTLPPGDVKRKTDHENHSILTGPGPDCAGAWPAHAATMTANIPPITQRHPRAIVSLRLSVDVVWLGSLISLSTTARCPDVRERRDAIARQIRASRRRQCAGARYATTW